jgi:hypothetical protein
MQHSFKPLHNKSFTFKKALLVNLHFITEGYLSMIITHWFHSTLIPGCHASVHPKKNAVLFKIGILFSSDAVNYDKSIVLLPEAIVRMVLQLPSREHEVYNGKEIKVSLV